MSDDPVPIDVRKWVSEAPAGSQARRRREITEIVLNTIAISSELQNTCHLKGGVLMGLLFGSLRLTADIDLTSTAEPGEDSATAFVEALDAAMNLTAIQLAYPNYILRVHSWKEMPKKHSFTDGSTWPALKLKINYADRRVPKQMKTFEKGDPVEIMNIDVSFNEPITHIEILELDEGNTLLAYGMIEVLAEKYRALIQQPIRNRGRRQDVYDIGHILDHDDISEVDRGDLVKAIISKSEGRPVEHAISQDALRNPKVAEKAQAEWNTLEKELDDVPDFDPLFEKIRDFYEALPW